MCPYLVATRSTPVAGPRTVGPRCVPPYRSAAVSMNLETRWDRWRARDDKPNSTPPPLEATSPGRFARFATWTRYTYRFRVTEYRSTYWRLQGGGGGVEYSIYGFIGRQKVPGIQTRRSPRLPHRHSWIVYGKQVYVPFCNIYSFVYTRFETLPSDTVFYE